MDSRQIRVVTAEEAKELNAAVRTLLDFCAKSICAGCPFIDLSCSGTVCGLRATIPEHWDTVELTEFEAI